MSATVERVRSALAGAGVEAEILRFPHGTRTAQDAARAIGTTIEQIVKSLVFLADGDPVLVLASGVNRVDTRKLANVCGARRVEKADADTVRRVTGFSIGGVAPVGHENALRIFVDRDLLKHAVVYAAAGTPDAVFPIAPDRLVAITGGSPTDLREE